MKHIKAIVFIGLLSFSFNARAAQNNSDIVKETFWYLQLLVLDDEEIAPPLNEEVQQVPFFFSYGTDTEPCYFTTGICNEIISFSYPSEDTITLFANDPFPNLDCQLQENIDFDALYFDFLANTTEFPYELIDNPGSLQLILTAPNGDMAIYGDELLAIKEENINSFKAYPNPVQDVLLLEIPQEVKQPQVTVYNASGKEIVRTSQELSNINMSAYSQGLYFVVVTTDQGDVVKKIMKQ
jgi:hypothetical protein